jgi:prophage regulatory protein
MNTIKSEATAESNPEDKFMRLPAVMARIGLGRSSIYAGVKARTFPNPIHLSPRAVAWNERDIRQWQADRIKASKGVV